MTGALYRPVGVALVGCGYWGLNLCRVLARSQAFDLRWICDAQGAALDRGAALAPGARTTANLEDVLGDDATEAVVVATPVSNHRDVALMALQQEKHCFVEKPLARTVDQATQLCGEAAARELVLMVGHTFLYNAAVRRTKQIIDAGELGELLYIVCQRLNLGVVRSDVDALWNLAPHDISMLNYWLDRPVLAARAVGHSFLQAGVADVVFADLSFAGNIGAHIHVSWLDPGKIRRATIVGSRKMLVFDDMLPDQRITVLDKGIDITGPDEGRAGFGSYADHKLVVRSGDVWIPRVDVPEPLMTEMEEFAGCIRENRAPISDGLSGLEVVRVLERLSESMFVATQ